MLFSTLPSDHGFGRLRVPDPGAEIGNLIICCMMMMFMMIIIIIYIYIMISYDDYYDDADGDNFELYVFGTFTTLINLTDTLTVVW